MQACTRRTALWIAFAATAALAGCGAGKPEAATTRFYKLVDGKKVDEAIEMFSTKDIAAEQMTTARGKFTTMIGQMQATMAANGGLDEVAIDNVEQANENSARVRSTLKFKNGKTKQDNMNMVREDGKWRISVKLK